jgi:MFS family permease
MLGPLRRRQDDQSIFYGWYLVALTVFTLTIVQGPVFQGLGVFLVALERHFGWSRTTLSLAFSLSRAEGALLGPFEGYFTDRLGTRRMVFIGLIVLSLGLIGFGLIQGLISFYIAFLVIFAGTSIGGFLPLMAAINHWFVRRRAAAMAIGMIGINAGGMLVPILAWAVTTFGWRETVFGLAFIIAMLTVPITKLIRNRPEEYGLRPDGDPPHDLQAKGDYSEGDKAAEPNFTVGEALRTSAFWIITAAHGVSAIAAATVSVHIIPAITDMGASLSIAALVVMTYTITGMLFQLVAGFLGDRVRKPPAIAAFIAIQGTGMLIAALIRTVPGAFLFAILYGIGFGGRIPLLTAIRGDYFGRKAFATILGVSFAPMNIAQMGAPVLAGYFFDTRGSYTLPFAALAILNFVGCGLILFVRKPEFANSNNNAS